MELKGIKINFLGDSITQGVGASSEHTVYHAVLKKEVGLAEARNYGISGTRFALQKGTPSRPKDDYVDVNSFCERFESMDDDADVVVVFGGTNDYGHGDAGLGNFSDRTPDTFYGACHYLFSGLIKKYLGKTIVIMTPLHRIGEMEIPEVKESKNYGVLKDYVNIIREVAEFYSLPVLDLYAASGLQPEIKEIQENYIPDGLHPNDNGNAVISHKLKKFLELL
ncbi:MAG: SGNH/GDSL hydrolase family protein [Clostridia bacterium]|nr:SGNH/GDSL hydrolase family protein [Clostridia bacterium]